MANCCFLSGTLSCKDELNQEKLYKLFEKSDKESEGEGKFFGSTDKYFFDFAFDKASSKDIIFNCWVKWSLERTDLMDFYNWIKSNDITITSFSINYEELGCDVLGEYKYSKKKGIITDNFVTDFDTGFDRNSDDFDDYSDDHLEALYSRIGSKKYSKTEIVFKE